MPRETSHKKSEMQPSPVCWRLNSLRYLIFPCKGGRMVRVSANSMKGTNMIVKAVSRLSTVFYWSRHQGRAEPCSLELQKTRWCKKKKKRESAGNKSFIKLLYFPAQQIPLISKSALKALWYMWQSPLKCDASEVLYASFIICCFLINFDSGSLNCIFILKVFHE